MVNYENKDLCMFVDGIGHVTLATFVEKIDDNRIRVKNPMWLSLVPRQDEKGNVRIALETPAWAFRDFFADHNDDQLWDIKVDNYSWYEGKSFSDMLTSAAPPAAASAANPAGDHPRIEASGINIPEV